MNYEIDNILEEFSKKEYEKETDLYSFNISFYIPCKKLYEYLLYHNLK